jgi:putative ABC transport system permease protein
LTEAELNVVQGTFADNYQVSRTLEMFSMVANGQQRSRLVQLKVIEQNYPFYGKIQLQEQGPVTAELHAKLAREKVVWVYPELLRQLDVEIGETLKIGRESFVVDDVVAEDAAAGISTNMAPRIYLNQNFLGATDLLKKGSIAWHSVLYQLPGRTSDDLDKYRETIFKILEAPEVQVYTHENVSEQMATLISRLNDFLGLSSLVALFLAAVGAAFLFRSYFRQRIQQMAVLLCLGANRRQAFTYYLLQVLFLGLVSAGLATVLGYAIVPGLGALTQDLLPFRVEFQLSPWTLVIGLLIGTLGSLFICLPLLVSIKDLNPARLLVANVSDSRSTSWWSVVATLPFFATFWGLAVWLAHSYRVGTLFVVLFLGAGLILGGGAVLLFHFLESHLTRGGLSLRWALRDLARKRLTTVAGFVAIGLGSLLLNIIPQIQKSLEAELQRPDQSKLPSLFMFDIQEEQLATFRQTLAAEGVAVDYLSPMIRGRLMSVNSEDFDKGQGLSDQFSREEEREMRFRNRGFNLSYRETMSEAESLVEGRPFSGTYDPESDQLAEISVEKRFAKRLGLKIGDRLSFDVESIPIEGQIINLRSVRWTSFRPNFFVLFQPGVLELAPKTYVATLPNLPLKAKQDLQDRLVEVLPNVSMVDVSRIIGRISGIMEQMSWALAVMSFLCLLAGFVVIFSIANHQAKMQFWEVGLLKALGASFAVIRNLYYWQFGLLSLFALSFGALVSLAVSYYFSTLLFESLWAFNWWIPLTSVITGTFVTLSVVHLAIRRSLVRKTQQLFSEIN